MGNGTAIAVTEKTVGQFVMDVLPNLQNYAIRKYDSQAWAKTVMLAIVENKDLMACLQTNPGKTSLYHALRLAAASGLSLNPQEGEACLVAIDGKVNFWKEKNGIVRLLLETNVVSSVYGDAIRENDKFRVTKSFRGDDYEHIPALKGRGEITGVYSAIMERSGVGHVYYMTREQVEEHKKKYGKGLNNPKMGWNTSWEGMAIKTAIKMGAARLSLPKEVKAAIESEEGDGGDAPIPVEFKEVPGVTAAEVEAKLRDAKPATQPTTAQTPPVDQASTTAPTAVATPTGAQGSAPSTPEAEGTGDQGKLEIF